jgi:epoxyqueuosine reductase
MQEGFQRALQTLTDREGETARPAAQRCRRLGNWGSPEAVPALAIALNDEESLVRGHAAWALGRIPDERSLDALRTRLADEDDAWVVSEIESSLDQD